MKPQRLRDAGALMKPEWFVRDPADGPPRPMSAGKIVLRRIPAEKVSPLWFVDRPAR